MNTDAKISLQYFSILWGIYLEVELLDHIIIRLIFFRNHNTTYPFWLSFLVCIMGLLWGLIWKDYNQCCAVLRSLLLCQTLVLLTLLIGLDPKGHPSPAHCQDFHSPVLSSIKFKWLLQGYRFWFTCSCLSLVFILKKDELNLREQKLYYLHGPSLQLGHWARLISVSLFFLSILLSQVAPPVLSSQRLYGHTDQLYRHAQIAHTPEL